MIKDFILPEFVTDSKLCEQELRTLKDNISYLENLRLEYLKKLAKLTGKKVFVEQINCNCTYESYFLANNKDEVGPENEYYGELDIIDDVIESNFVEEVK